MTSTTATSATTRSGPPPGSDGSLSESPRLLSNWARGCITVLALLFISLHWPFIERMVRIATNASGDNLFDLLKAILAFDWNHDWSHIVAIPFIALYYVMQNRRALLEQPTQVYWPGLGVMIGGIFSFMFWIYPGRNDLFQGLSMLIGLTGLVVFLLGPRVLTVLWFPIAYLVFAIKVPDSIWNRVAYRMQDLAASVSTVALKILGPLFGFETDKLGNQISITYSQGGQLIKSDLAVAEACAGLRMLMAFMALGVAMAFFSKRPMWQKLILVAATAPIAIIVNVGRVTILGLLSLINPEFARGDLHIMVGLIIMLPSAALLLMLLGWILNRIIIREESRGDGQLESERPIRVHPSWRAGQVTALNMSKALQLAGGALGGATIIILTAGTALLTLAYYRPDVIELLLPVLEGAGVQPWMGLFTAPVAAVLVGVLFWWLRRSELRQRVTVGALSGNRTFAVAVAAGVLLSASLGFSSVMAAARIVHFKAPVPLRDQLYMLPQEVRGWEMVGKDERLPPEVEEELGTHDYLSRHYVRRSDNQVVRLHVAYYTGTPDTVPHVPDRCFMAGGATGTSVDRSKYLELTGSHYFERDDQWWAISPMEPYEVRVPAVRFHATCFTYLPPQPGGLGLLPTVKSDKDLQANVVYFFAANGRFLPSPNDVRLQGFDPRDRHAYYCKIEVGVEKISDPDEAMRIASEFLSAMMPEILRCLPDWVDVVEGRWPPQQN